MGRERVVGYKITNVGTASENIIVKITDTSGFVQGISFKRHEIGPGESVNDTFSIRPTLSSESFEQVLFLLLNLMSNLNSYRLPIFGTNVSDRYIQKSALDVYNKV